MKLRLPPRAARAAAAILIAAAAIAVYLPGLPGEFVYDDSRLIAGNDGLKRPFDPARAFLRDYYASDLDRGGLGYYRPLAILSNELDYRRGGGAPLPFHLTNIAMHAGSSLLVFALGLILFEGAVATAAAAAMLFALHPAHAESVAFISGRVDPLMALFGLAALWAHLQAGRIRRPSILRAAAALAWLAALLSKEMAITVPVLATLLETAREGLPRREDLLRRASRYVPFAAAGFLYVAMRWVGLGRLLGPPAANVEASFSGAVVTLGSYLAWLVVPPWGLHLEPPMVRGVGAWLAALLVAAAIAAGILLWLRGRRIEGALLGWCLISLLPVLQIRPIETTLSERFLYLPSAGAVLLLAALALRFPARPGWRAAGAVLLLGVGAYWTGVLLYRVPLWRDGMRLWTVKAQEEPDSSKAALNLAEGYAARGEREKALAAFERARKLGVDATLIDGEVASVLGAATPEERVATIRRTIERSPQDGALRSNLGFLLLDQGDLAGAGDAFAKAIEVSPARAEAWLGLAMVRLRLKDVVGAAEAAGRAESLRPDLTFARALRAECELRMGRPCEALRLAEGIELEDPAERAALERVREVARKECGAARAPG